MWQKLFTKFILFIIFGACANVSSAEPTLLATHEDIDVYLLQCTAGTAHIDIQAKNGEVFDDVKSGVGKFLRTMKYIVPGHCPDVQTVKIKGTAGNELWFAAATTVADNWQVKSLFVPPVR